MSNFANIMDEMRSHYKNNLGKSTLSAYNLNLSQGSLSLGGIASTDADNNPELKNLEKTSQELSLDTNFFIEDGVMASGEELKASGNSEAFKEKMKKLREEAKRKAEENIDKIFNKAEELGNRHPSWQESILTVTNKISSWISQLFDRLVNTLVTFINTVVQWVENVVKSVKSAFNDIKHWISKWF